MLSMGNEVGEVIVVHLTNEGIVEGKLVDAGEVFISVDDLDANNRKHIPWTSILYLHLKG